MTHAKRRAKFAKVGFTSPYISQYKDVYFTEVSAETLEALRQDAASVEEQRKAWEEGKTTTKGTRTAPTSDTMAEDAAPAEGLRLVEIPEGVAVVGDTRTTYANRKAIKAHGATWNKVAQRWEGTTPEAVEALRNWFGITDDCELWDTDKIREAVNAEPMAEDAEPVPTMDAADIEALRILKEKREAEARQQADTVARIAVAFAELCQMLEEVAAAQRSEAERIAEEATAKARATEAEQLRRDMATMSEQLAQMGAALQAMAARLAELEHPTTAAEAPNDGATADPAAEPAPAMESAGNEAPTMTEEERERVRARFIRYSDWAYEYTDENNHTQALRTQCAAIIDRYGNTTLRAAELDTELEKIDQAHTKRCYILPEEIRRREAIKAELIRLTANEYGEELAAILWGEYRVNKVMHPETEAKAV